jgi:hypothetical protein
MEREPVRCSYSGQACAIRRGGGYQEQGLERAKLEGLMAPILTTAFMIEGNEYNLFLKVLKNSEEF